MTTSKLYTLEQVADILQVSVQTVRRLIRDKKLSAVRVGTQLRITQAELDRFLSEETI